MSHAPKPTPIARGRITADLPLRLGQGSSVSRLFRFRIAAAGRDGHCSSEERREDTGRRSLAFLAQVFFLFFSFATGLGLPHPRRAESRAGWSQYAARDSGGVRAPPCAAT